MPNIKLLEDPIWIHALRALADGAPIEAIDVRNLSGDALAYINKLRKEVRSLSKKLEEAKEDADGWASVFGMIKEVVDAQGCNCDSSKEDDKATPPYMYPEKIKCMIAKIKAENKEKPND